MLPPYFDDLTLQANFRMDVWDRGRLTHRIEKHNIMVNYGRNWLTQAIGEPDYVTNPITHKVNFIKYIGFGIGSAKQISDLNSLYPSLSSAYPGSNVQDDTDPTIQYLERPIAVRDNGGGGTVWLAEASYAPGPSSPYTYADFTISLSDTDLNVVPGHAFGTVPVSEVGLFLSDSDPNSNPSTTPLVFYISLSPISITNTMSLDVRWRLIT